MTLSATVILAPFWLTVKPKKLAAFWAHLQRS
jgi:hypothetical protein